MILSAIAAMARNRVIGVDGDLPWNIPEDFKFFKDKTSGHAMIMGRKTFESLPQALPGRLHIIVTRQEGYAPSLPANAKPGTALKVVSTIEDAVAFARTKTSEYGDEVFILGGGEIYKQMLSITDRIYLTEIHQDFPGDTKFPEFSKTEFIETERKPRKAGEGPNPSSVSFDFVTYDRK
nr:Dihydrofolate reductase [uncultured bacterium]